MIALQVGSQTLGEKLRALREDFDLSQSQVAAALRIDRSTYSNYELDKTRPSLEMLVKLAHIYGVPKASFLPDDPAEEEPVLRDTSRPDSMVRSLSKEERGMLVLYRALPREQRAKICEEMAKMTKSQPQ